MTREGADTASTLHVVGAGLAGLAAATAAAGRGDRVIVWEAARVAGGRCRSFEDRALGHVIDNGNHLILSGNRATLAYLERLDARDRLHEIKPAAFPFRDLATGNSWTLRPREGRVPWWLLRRRHRPPGVALLALLRGAGQILAGRAGSALVRDAAFARFWEPLITAVLNTAPAEADLRLMRPVLLETLGRGERFCRPLIAREGLGHALIDPALRFLEARGGGIRLGARVDALERVGDRVAGLVVGGETLPLGSEDRLVLATPPWITAALLPGLVGPRRYGPIVNAHFAVAGGGDSDVPGLLGLVGGTAEWIFRRRHVVSVTVSAADHIVEAPADDLAARLWRDVRQALDLGDSPLPPYRIIKEKRATPWQTRAAEKARWPTATAWRNAALAGDWVATGLPATIESAVRSGEQALAHLDRAREWQA